MLQVLSANNSLWDRCCGPNGQGLSTQQLLAGLQSRFPDTGWTETLLSSVLVSGQRQGRIKQLPEDTWYLNTNMLRVNPANAIYQRASSAICGLPSGCACTGLNSTLA